MGKEVEIADLTQGQQAPVLEQLKSTCLVLFPSSGSHEGGKPRQSVVC